MSQVNPALRASVAQSVLRKNGYLHGDVSYVEVPRKNPKKMKIGYTVTLDSLFTIDTLSYVNFPSDMQVLIDSTLEESNLTEGKPFSVSTLDAERSRISQLFRNNGYYYYSPGYTTYLADTFDIPCHAKLRLQLADSLPANVLQKWYLGTMSISLRKTAREELSDSIGRRFLKIFYNGKKPPLRPRVLVNNMKLRPRKAYSNDDYLASMQNLNATGMFSSTDFTFTPRLDSDTIDLAINCVFDKPYDFYVETNLINRTIGRMGPEMRVGFTKRNAFHGGEKLDVNLHGSYEWQVNGGDSEMNTYQYGADASIEFPRIIAPFFGERSTPSRDRNRRRRRFRRYYSTPWTVAKVSTDIIHRPEYYKMHIVSGEWTYKWQTSERSRHEFSPLTLKYQFMNTKTEKFEEIIRTNSYLSTTMDDHFIPKMRYTYVFSSPKTNIHPSRWETTIEEAGNVASLYFVARGDGWNQEEKTMFKNPYSQFVRLETDYSKLWPLDKNSQLVAHVNAGILWAYGNSSTYPFSEGFYVGGANSIRAFGIRSIGPGAFPGFGDSQSSYLLQNGDIKFVFNLEYRRKLVNSLYGAVFFDAGNIWNRKSMIADITDDMDTDLKNFAIIWNEAFSDSQFKVKNFFKQLATGTGIGLRYDLDFLVVRVDWGFGLHVPYKTSKSGYFNIERFKDMHTLHLAIGYPF
jgi:outer membrane protein assembly factor BamA